MDVSQLSNVYDVRLIRDEDVWEVYQLCKGNPLFYHYCPPAVTIEGIKADMHMLPPGKGMEDKYYIGFYDHDRLIAVMDLVSGYPDEKTAYIGFFMMDASFQGRGIGSKIIEDACTYLKRDFFSVRLAYVKGNEQSASFWIKNHFTGTGVVTQAKDYELVNMQRVL